MGDGQALFVVNNYLEFADALAAIFPGFSFCRQLPAKITGISKGHRSSTTAALPAPIAAAFNISLKLFLFSAGFSSLNILFIFNSFGYRLALTSSVS